MASAAGKQPDPIFAEFDVVRTRATIDADGYTYRSGSLGAIVFVHRDGKAFEVELSDPRPLVVTLEAAEIELAQ